MVSPGEITTILGRMGKGDPSAYDCLLPLVYDELRELAERAMAGQRPDHTLSPTALVHESYLRLLGKTQLSWQNRAHFLAVAARAMRQILIDHARARLRKKRGSGARKVSLDGLAVPSGPEEIDLLALNEGLAELEELEPRAAKVVELRFFGSLTRDEVAEILGVTTRTVAREWQYAQAWLCRKLLGRSSAPREDGERGG